MKHMDETGNFADEKPDLIFSTELMCFYGVNLATWAVGWPNVCIYVFTCASVLFDKEIAKLFAKRVQRTMSYALCHITWYVMRVSVKKYMEMSKNHQSRVSTINVGSFRSGC